MQTIVTTNSRATIDDHYNADKLNALFKKGFRFYCEGNYRTTGRIDGWSGMPCVESDVFAFTTKEEADIFALTQEWIFDKNVHPKVYSIPVHTLTWDEYWGKENAKKEEKKTKKLAKETAKAEAAGMTLEEYKKDKAKKAKIRRLEREIAELEAEINEKKAYLKKLKET
jgi:hypothetical protein